MLYGQTWHLAYQAIFDQNIIFYENMCYNRIWEDSILWLHKLSSFLSMVCLWCSLTWVWCLGYNRSFTLTLGEIRLTLKWGCDKRYYSVTVCVSQHCSIAFSINYSGKGESSVKPNLRYQTSSQGLIWQNIQEPLTLCADLLGVVRFKCTVMTIFCDNYLRMWWTIRGGYLDRG